MATAFVGPRGTPTFPIPQAVQAGTLQIWRGYYDITANPTANDTYDLCYVPAGAVIVGGLINAAIIDTNAGSETLDMDLGWAANGGSGTYDVLDTDGLGNFGVWKGDAFATGNINRVATNQMWLGGDALTGGIFPYFTKKTLIRLICNVTAATFSAGRVSVALFGDIDATLAA